MFWGCSFDKLHDCRPTSIDLQRIRNASPEELERVAPDIRDTLYSHAFTFIGQEPPCHAKLAFQYVDEARVALPEIIATLDRSRQDLAGLDPEQAGAAVRFDHDLDRKLEALRGLLAFFEERKDSVTYQNPSYPNPWSPIAKRVNICRRDGSGLEVEESDDGGVKRTGR